MEQEFAMAASLSGGVVRSMTRGAPTRISDDGTTPDDDMTLLDMMTLLRSIAEDPPPELDDLLNEIRRGWVEGTGALFDRLRKMKRDASDF